MYRELNVNWKQHCIGNGGSYHRSTSDDWLAGWDGELKLSSKHVVVSLDTVLWTVNVVKWIQIYVLKEKDTTDMARTRSYLDLHIEIDDEGRLITKFRPKRWLQLPVVNFPFICSDIPGAPVYRVYVYIYLSCYDITDICVVFCKSQFVIFFCRLYLLSSYTLFNKLGINHYILGAVFFPVQLFILQVLPNFLVAF